MDIPVEEFSAQEHQILEWFSSLSNWGRWGPEDECGTLNLITDEARRRGAAAVRHGIPISCAWDLQTGHRPGDYFATFQRYMIGAGEGYHDAHRVDHSPGTPFGAALEFIGLVFHGWNVTHLDALSHCFWEGKLYNGRPAEQVTTFTGATRNAVTSARDGITSRGVLLDVAAVRGVPWLEPATAILPEDLDAAERRQGVKVQSGDIVLVYSGYSLRKKRVPTDPTTDGPGADGCCGGGPGAPGPHVSLTPWLRERDVALFASDTGNDVVPSGLHPYFLNPFHTVTQVFMGLWLLDNCDLSRLAEKCAELNQWDFLFSAPPLLITGGTGSPVNPVALL